MQAPVEQKPQQGQPHESYDDWGRQASGFFANQNNQVQTNGFNAGVATTVNLNDDQAANLRPENSEFYRQQSAQSQIQQSPDQTGPQFNTNDYMDRVRRKFIEFSMWQEGARMEGFTGKTPQEYVRMKIDEDISKQTGTTLQNPKAENLKIDNNRHYVGNAKKMKKGFCGSSCVVTNLDLFIDANGEMLMKPTNNSQVSDTLKAGFKDIKVSELKEIIAGQKTAEGKKKIAGNLELVIDAPAGDFRYILAFSRPGTEKGQIERCYFFFKDDEELESFRNSFMTFTNAGKKYLQDKTVPEGGAANLPDFIMRRRILISEMIMRNFDSWVESKIAERNRNIALKMTPEQKREFIRRATLRVLLKRELSVFKSVDQKKKEICMKLYRNLSMKNEEHMRTYAVTKWKRAMIDLREQELRQNKTAIVVTPCKYYNLYPDNENKDDLNTLNIDELHLVVSLTQQSQSDVLGHDFPHQYPVDLLPLPNGSSLQATEFRIVSHIGSLDLSQLAGKYLTAYIRNKEDRTVTSIGHLKIEPRMPHLVILQMFDHTKRHSDNSQAFMVGAVVLKREGVHLPNPGEPVFTELTDPSNFGYMKKLYSVIVKDMGLGNIGEAEGVGRKYYKIKNYLGADYTINNEIAQFESNRYRLSEWKYFEDIVAGLNNLHVRRSGAAADNYLTTSDSFKKFMINSTSIDPYSVDRSSKSYLFFSRESWRNVPEFSKNKDFQVKALVTGMPDYLYVPVWKSLGKVNLIQQLVYDICRHKIPKYSLQGNLFDQLASAGRDEISFNPNIEKDLAEMDKEYSFGPTQYTLIRKVVSAYLKLSILMEDVSNDKDLNGMIIKGFSLKTVGGMCHIVRHLVKLVEISKKNTHMDERCKYVSDEDVFWVALSICFVFLPEHFLNPLLDFTPQQDTEKFYETLKALGIDLAKYLKNKMFLSSSSVGSYKLSIILAQCILKEAPEIYEKMTDLGFPFLTYCLDNCESLLSEYLNPDTLSKFWNLIFFEGADFVKKRAQQMLLCAFMTTIKNTRLQIMNSRSSQEVLWHLKAYGYFNFEGTQFIMDMLKFRNVYFVKEVEGAGLISKVNSMFSATRGIEEEYQEIKGEITSDLEQVSKANSVYLTFLTQIVNIIEKTPNRYLDLNHLKTFLDSWSVKMNIERNKNMLHFDNNFTQEEYMLADKPQVKHVIFGISTWDFGNYLPENTSLQFATNFRRDTIVARLNDNNWCKLHTLDGSIIQSCNQAWIDVKLEGKDRKGKAFSYSQRFSLDRVRFNKPSYFAFQYNSFWMVLHIKITSDSIKTDNSDYFGNLDHDKQHRKSIFCEEFADAMQISRETPYKEEILNNTCTPPTLETIMAYAFKAEGIKFNADVNRFVMKNDIFGKGTPNLFETTVRLILFSPVGNAGILKLLFNLLTKLDLTYDTSRVKKTHVQFLIWYVLRTAQIYLPYIEIVSTVSRILHGSDSNIVSAVVTNLYDPRKPSLDITDLLNLWFVAQRRRTGDSSIVIGNKGYLNPLAKAINHWRAEQGQSPFQFAKLNKLRIFINSKGTTKKLEFKFDDTMRVILDSKDRDTAVEGDQVVLLEDTEESLNYSQFIKVMSRFQILDWIFSRLTGIGSDQSYAQSAREAQELAMKTAKNYDVLVKFRVADSGEGRESLGRDVGVIHLQKLSAHRLIDYKQDQRRLNFLVDNKSKFSFGEDIPTLNNVQLLDNETSIRTMVEESLQLLSNQVVDSVDVTNYHYKYRKDCLSLLAWDTDTSRITVQDRRLNNEHYDASISKITQLLKDPPRIHILVELTVDEIPARYNHMAKDIYYLEGVDVVENPFVPCEIISKNSAFAEVHFKNDNGNVILNSRKENDRIR